MMIMMELSIYSGFIIDSEQIISLSDVIHHGIKYIYHAVTNHISHMSHLLA